MLVCVELRGFCVAEPHGQWAGSGYFSGISLPAASSTPVYNHRADALWYVTLTTVLAYDIQVITLFIIVKFSG